MMDETATPAVETPTVEAPAVEVTQYEVVAERSAAVHQAAIDLMNAGVLSLTHPLVVALVAALKG